MVCVRAKKNENIESLIRRFKKVCEDNEILNDSRKKEFFEKPSTVRHRRRMTQKQRRSQ